MIKFLNIINDRFYILVNFSINIVKTPIQRNFLNQFGFMLLASCLIGSHFDAALSVKREVLIVVSTQIRQAAEGFPPEAREYLENMADYLIKASEGEFESNLLKAKIAAAEGAHYLTDKSLTSKKESSHYLRAVVCHLMSASIVSSKKETADHLQSMADHIIAIIEKF